MKGPSLAAGAVCFFLSCSPALAGWVASLVEDEGGPTMQAFVEAGTAEIPSDFRVQCLAHAQLGVRYGMGSDLPAGTTLPSSAPIAFSLSIDGSIQQIDMQFEELDGAFAAYLSIDHPLFIALRKGSKLSIDDPTGLYHAVDFTLDGSDHAINQLVTTCPD